MSRSLLLAFLLFASACSAKNPAADPTDAGADDGIVGCAGQGDTYTANLQKPGQLGKYTFTLVKGAPAPPDLDGNVWTMKIVDGAGASPDLSQVTVYPFMPLMGHPSSQTPLRALDADGTFTVSNIYLFMPGLWTVTVSVTAPPSAGDGGAEGGAASPTPAAVLDKAAYTFCIN